MFSVLFIFSNCIAQKRKVGKINTKINEEYAKSSKEFYGKLDSVQNKEIRGIMAIELNTDITENKAILINYYQYGNNCFEYGFNKKEANNVLENGLKISARMSKENNTVDFFVYSEDALNKKSFINNKLFKLDNGFFSQNIFTLKENCSAFFILKPDGNFMKYYGFDYYSIVEEFLKRK